MVRAGGVTAVVAATGTAACGLLMLAGVGPSSAAAELGSTLPGDVGVLSSYTTTTTEPSRSTSTTSIATVPTTTISTSTVASTSTEPPTTIPASSTTAATTAAPTTTPAASPVPLSVSPTTVTVGPGGSATISGSCGSVGGRVLGPVEIWQIGATVTVIPTNVIAAEWSYQWTAPTTPEQMVLQPWCGPPGDHAGGYPASLQVEVIFVAQAAVTTSSSPATADPGGSDGGAIPQTD